MKPWEKPPRIYPAEKAGGAPRPSVTEVLSILDKSGPFMGWALKECTNYLDLHQQEIIDTLDNLDMEGWHQILKDARSAHRHVSDKAKDVGHRVHEIVHDFGQGLPVVLDDEPDQVKRGVQAFLSWGERSGLIFTEGEQTVWSDDLDTAGTLDALGLIGGTLAVLDWKTSRAIYPEYFVQASVYAHCYEEMHKQRVGSVWIVRFDKETGAPEEREVKDRAAHVDAFRAMRKAWQWKQDCVGRGVSLHSAIV